VLDKSSREASVWIEGWWRAQLSRQEKIIMHDTRTEMSISWFLSLQASPEARVRVPSPDPKPLHGALTPKLCKQCLFFYCYPFPMY
jgi:hypothetical protein